MRLRLSRMALAALTAMGLSAAASATVLYTTPGDVFTENFDDTAISATTVPWTDDTTVPDWYAYQFGGTDQAAGPVAEMRTTNGESTGIVLYRWRIASSSGEFAFGTKPIDSTGDVAVALRLTNNTGVTLTEFTLGYTGEQWTAGGSGNNNQLVVAYQIGSPANLGDGAWTPIDDLVFNSPEDVLDDATIDGNDAANREVLDPVTVTGLDWTPGADLWIRWFDNNTGGTDNGLAIDDLSFSADVPEPASLALLALGGAVMLKRRRES